MESGKKNFLPIRPINAPLTDTPGSGKEIADEESKRLAVGGDCASTVSTILLSNRPVGSSLRSKGSTVAPENDADDSFDRIFGCRPAAPSLKPVVEQAEKLEEVVHELSAFYGVSEEDALKALKDSGYSVKKAICKIVRGNNVNIIVQSHRQYRH